MCPCLLLSWWAAVLTPARTHLWLRQGKGDLPSMLMPTHGIEVQHGRQMWLLEGLLGCIPSLLTPSGCHITDLKCKVFSCSTCSAS